MVLARRAQIEGLAQPFHNARRRCCPNESKARASTPLLTIVQPQHLILTSSTTSYDLAQSPSLSSVAWPLLSKRHGRFFLHTLPPATCAHDLSTGRARRTRSTLLLEALYYLLQCTLSSMRAHLMNLMRLRSVADLRAHVQGGRISRLATGDR